MNSVRKRIPVTHAAFSLIEILTCLSILSLLSILLGLAFTHYSQRAISTQCVANLRQIGVAFFAYSGDHEGKIPPRIQPDPDNPGLYLSGTYWHQVLRRNGYFGIPPREVTHAERIIAQMTGQHFCPEIPSTGTSDEAYGMRRWKTPGQPIDISQNLKALENPADFFLLADSIMVSRQLQGYSLGNGTSSWRIRFSHSQKANALFADGHIASLQYDYFDRIVPEQADYSYTTLPFSYWPEPVKP